MIGKIRDMLTFEGLAYACYDYPAMMELRKGRAAIRAYMESLAPLVERGGFIPFCDHRCPPDVNPDDYLYYLDLKEAMFGMRTRPGGSSRPTRSRRA